MTNKIVIYSSFVSQDGVPALERKNAFYQYFEKQGFIVERRYYPNNFWSKLLTIVKSVINNEVSFLSMPPFRYWYFFFAPFSKVIVDFRDGWAVAMKNGYGGVAKKRPLKAWFSGYIEKYAIRRSVFAITCTPGLQNYFEKVSGKKVLLIPNSFSEEDILLAEMFGCYDQKKIPTNKYIVNAICIGKFSEYGEDNIKKYLQYASTYYCNSIYKIDVFGSDVSANYWVNDWIKDNNINNININFFPKIPRPEIYKHIRMYDHGVSIVRDPDYELGTKAFDYIACCKPIFNYFEKDNNFTYYFDGYLTHNNPGLSKQSIQSREVLMLKMNKLIFLIN